MASMPVPKFACWVTVASGMAWSADSGMFRACSVRCYSNGRIGLWKLSKTVSSVISKFIGYLLSTSYQWCKREVDTPFVIHESEEGKLLCYYGGRSRNIWTEGLAIFDKGILPK
jgi:hypothetical protein